MKKAGADIVFQKSRHDGVRSDSGAFLALLAALFLVVGPYLPLLAGPGSDGRLIEICTAQGLGFVAQAGDFPVGAGAGQPPSGDDGGGKSGGKPCPFCFARVLSFSAPERIVLREPSWAGVFFAPVETPDFPRSFSNLSFSHAPRAPPVSFS